LDLSRIEPHLMALSRPPAAGAGDPLARLGHLLVVLGEFLPALVDLGSDEHPKPVHRAVLSATELMHADPAASWTLPELAMRVHTSAPYLCRCVTRELGISPMKYLERFRLELAAQHLLDSEVSITEISARVGMSDPNYLARRFRATHGMSPSRYRTMFAAGSPRGLGIARTLENHSRTRSPGPK
jgi:AraC-like DNA-binding protein